MEKSSGNSIDGDDDEDSDRRREQLDRFIRSNRSREEGGEAGRHHNYNGRDFDTRSHCSSQKSDPSSEIGRGDPSAESLVYQGDGGGDRGFLPHGHVHFGQTSSTAHLLNGDPPHQFPPSLYQASADAPKSDTATVCSGSVLEDDVEDLSHYSGDVGQSQTASAKHHHYPPPSVGTVPTTLRRSSSPEGNRLVDYAARSQEALRAVVPKQNKPSSAGYAESSSSHTGSGGGNDEDVNMAGMLQHKKGMGPPLSRQWLLQQHGSSVKSGGSYAGSSDVVVNVGSDCGGSLTDMQSVTSQEDALLLTANSELSGEASSGAAFAALDMDTNDNDTNNNMTTEDEKKPHPLLCDQSDRQNGRTSPGGTIYRGRGVRRYKGRFYSLPLKRFHQNGVHLHSDNEQEGTTMHYGHQSDSQQHQHQQQDASGDRDRCEDPFSGYRDDNQRGGGGGGHDYHGQARRRSRSRSRSRSPPSSPKSRRRISDQTRGYQIKKKDCDDHYNDSKKKPPRHDRGR